MSVKFLKRNIMLIVIMIIFFIYFVYTMYTTNEKLNEYRKIQNDLNQEIANLESNLNRLHNELEYAQTTEAIEKIAREKLKMVKPNEIIYMIKGLDNDAE